MVKMYEQRTTIKWPQGPIAVGFFGGVYICTWAWTRQSESQIIFQEGEVGVDRVKRVAATYKGRDTGRLEV